MFLQSSKFKGLLFFSSLRQLVEKPPITGKEINSLSASQMIGFKLAPGPVPKEYRHFDVANGNNFDDQPASNSGGYQEFGINFNDPEDVKAKNRKKIKRSLDDLEGIRFINLFLKSFWS